MLDYAFHDIAKMIDHSLLQPVSRVGATRTAEMLDDCRRRIEEQGDRR